MIKTNRLFATTALLIAFASGCARASLTEPGFDPSGDSGNSGQGAFEELAVQLETDLYLRTLRSGVLESVAILPEGTRIAIPADGQTVNHPYRDESGKEGWSSTGFLPVARIVSVPASSQAQFPPERLRQLHALPGGLFISAVAAQGGDSPESSFPPIEGAIAQPDYLSFYAYDGKPKFQFTAALKKKFGGRLNKGRPMTSLPASEQTKWRRIMGELERAGDRTTASPRYLLMMNVEEGKRLAEEFEKTGKVPLEGAWTVAVQGTAVRHGFSNVPCAEFQSELIRQAYARAGYDHRADFNEKNKNVLSYKGGSALVANLTLFLDRAGWTPWDGSVYVPPAGAIVMNGTGNSPGHAYMSGGDRGRIIVDNGMPQGRDLRITSKKIIDMMYINGVFFLPPGFIPEKW